MIAVGGAAAGDDARDPEAVLSAPGVAGLLDFDQPVALLAIPVLHFITGDATALLGRYRQALTAGSIVALSHISDDVPDPAVAEQMRGLRAAYDTSATPSVLRDGSELRHALTGLEVIAPGLVDLTEWPDPAESRQKSWVYGAVGLVPRTGDLI